MSLNQTEFSKFIVHKRHFQCVKYDHYALYAGLISTVFSSRLKALWLVISWSYVGTEFPATGPANSSQNSSENIESVSCLIYELIST